MLLAAPKGAFRGLPRASGLLLATRKRVRVLFHRHLVVDLVLFQLIRNVLCNFLGVFSCRINIVPPSPEAPVPILVLKIYVPFVYHETALSLQISYEA